MQILPPLLYSLLKFIDTCNPSFHNHTSLIATSNQDKDETFAIKRNFNLDRVKEIHRVIDGSLMEEEKISSHSNPYKIFPIEIGEIIGGFEYVDASLECLYNLVVNKLELFMNETIKLDFDSDNFPNQLESFLAKIDLKGNDNLFWHDISRLLFKWLIQKKQEIADKNGDFINSADRFKMISNQLISIAHVIHKKSNLPFLFNFNLENRTISNNSEFQKLITIEIFENYSQLFSLFDSIIKDFYFNLNENQIKLERIKEIDCQLFKNKYFNGNYESNILLRYLIVMGDPWKILKRCIISEDPHLIYLKVFPLIPIIKNYSNGQEFKGFDIKGIVYTGYEGKLVIDLLLSINRRFIISNSKHLILLLKRLKESKLLTGNVIKRIVNFKSIHHFSNPDSLEWDSKTFEMYIDEYKRNLPLKSNNEQFECDEYLHLILPTRKFHDRVIGRLKMTLSDRRNLNFHNDNFVDRFNSILLDNAFRFTGDNSFWYNVAMLLLKWIIDRNRFRGINAKIENSSRVGIQSIISMILRNTLKDFPLFPFDFNLEFMNNSSFFILKELIDDELMMDSQILQSFSSILQDYYHGENEYFDCEKIRKKYFNRGIGGFNSDLILKFTIILYDPHGMIRRECFPNQDHLMINLFNLGREIISPVDYSFNRREFERVKNPFVVNVNHVNGSIIKYFLSTNRQFQMKIMGNLELEMEKEGIFPYSPFHDFFILLRKLKQEIEPLTIDLLMKLIKFDIPNNGENENATISYWKEKFQELLNVKMKLNPRAKNECLDYLKLLD